VYLLDTGVVVLPVSMETRLFQLAALQDNINQRMRFTRIVKSVVMKNPAWRAKVLSYWDKQGDSKPDVPEEIRAMWEPEARKWVDGMVKFEEE
jgi:hypothetical protein